MFVMERESRIHVKRKIVTSDKMSVGGSEWSLVDRAGQRLSLPPTMIFLGREECDVNIQSRSVDKRHAVLNYDSFERRFRVKDLSSLNGTFVNDQRIPEQEYVGLDNMDSLRFGYDPMVYRMERMEDIPQLEQPPGPDGLRTVAPSHGAPEEAPEHSGQREALHSHSVLERPPGPDGHHLVTRSSYPPPEHPPGFDGHQMAAPSYPPGQDGRPVGTQSYTTLEHPPGPDGRQIAPHSHVTDGHQMAPHSHSVDGHQMVPHSHSVDGHQVVPHSHPGTDHGRPHPHKRPDLPNWAAREGPTHCMAECQGCIVEQGIRHICGGHDEHHYLQTGAHGPVHMRNGHTPPSSRPQAYSQWQEAHLNAYHRGYTHPPPPHPHQKGAPLYSHSHPVSHGSPAHSHSHSSSQGVVPVPLPQQGTPPHSHQQGAPPHSHSHSQDEAQPMVSRHYVESTRQDYHEYVERPRPEYLPTRPEYYDYPPDYVSHDHRTSVSAPHHGDRTNLCCSHPHCRPHSHPAPHPSSHPPPLPPTSQVPVHPEYPPSYDSANMSGHYNDDDEEDYRVIHIQYETPRGSYISPVKEVQEVTVVASAPPAPRQGSPARLIESYSVDTNKSTAESPPSKDYDNTASPTATDKNLKNQSGGQHVPEQDTNTPNKPGGTPSQSNKSAEEGSPVHKGGSSDGTPGSPGGSPSHRKDKRRSLTGTESDLETVKKGTPLYGQPSWWGDEDAPTTDGNPGDPQKLHNGSERPSALSKDSSEVDMNKYKTDPKYAMTYMEIPQKDTEPEKDLFNKDKAAQPNTPPEKDVSPPKPAPEAAAAPMAFTVDFGDDSQLNMSDNLSRFLPSKVRKSFRTRQPKKEKDDKEGDSKAEGNKNTKGKKDVSPGRRRTTGDRRSGSPGRRGKGPGYHSDGHNSGPSSDNEDLSIRSDHVTTRTSKQAKVSKASAVRKAERQTSVGSNRSDSPQRRVSSPRAPVSGTKSGSSTPRSAGPSPRTPSGVSRTSKSPGPSPRTAKSPGPSPRTAKSPGPKSSSTKSPKMPRKSVGNEPKSQPGSAKGRRSKSPGDSIRKRAGPTNSSAQPSDYLIDKMFSDPGRGGGRRSGPSSTPSEYELYKEAEIYDSKIGSENVSSQHSAAVPKSQKSADGKSPRRSRGLKPPDEGIPDNLSETGTYTIESDVPSGDVEEARESIDQVFDVLEPGAGNDLKRPVVDDDDIVADDNGNEVRESELHQLEKKRSALRPADSMEVEVGSAAMFNQDAKHEFPSGYGTYTKSKGGNRKSANVVEVKTSVESVELKKSAEPKDRPGDRPTSATRKSRGGRILPTPPVKSGDAPSPRRVAGFTSPREEDCDTAMSDILSSMHEDYPGSPPETARSDASLDTEVLLQDTEHVVRAMAARVNGRTVQSSNKASSKRNSDLFIPIKDDDSDSEGSSSHAVVNGRSQRDAAKDRFRANKSLSSDTRKPPRPIVSRESSQRTRTTSLGAARERLQQANKNGRNRSGDLDYSDIHSESEGYSETASIISSTSEYSPPHSPRVTRKSGSKAPISSTRTNRAFALRRARVDGSDSEPPKPDTSSRPRSRPNSAGTTRDSSRPRPSSASARSTARSEVSLGGQIVAKSRDNQRVKSAGPMTRSDGGRYSLRNTPTRTLSTGSTSRPDLSKPKGSVTSLSVKGNKSLPNSRSSSPRTQEYNAWKRRKDYDPRKALQDAKAKNKVQKSSRTGRSHSEGPTDEWLRRSRGDTMSSISSEDNSFLEDPLPEDPPHFGGSVGTMSSALANNLGIMSRSIQGDEALSTGDLARNSSFHDLLSSSLSRSAFSVPQSTRSPPATFRGSPVPQSFSYGRSRSSLHSPNDKHYDLAETYDSLLVSSICQLSNKVTSHTDRIIDKMRETGQLSRSSSPIEDMLDQPREASHELSLSLRNLRRTERRLKDIEKTLFPGQDSGSDTMGSPRDHEEYLKELERIRSEIASFKPIEKPEGRDAKSSWRAHRASSHDSDILAGDEYY